MEVDIIKGELRWFGRQLDKSFKHLKIIVLSDVHYGNPLFSLKHFQRTIDYIKYNPDVYCILNGDLCESITIASKGNIYKQLVEPEMQRDSMIEFLRPIRDKILAMTTGNHEYRIKEIDISKDIAKELHIPYRAEGAMVKVSFGDGNIGVKGKPYVFWGYVTHGYGGARTKSAKSVKVERVGYWLSRCDFIAMSHDHTVNATPDVELYPDNRGTIGKDGFLSGKVIAHRREFIKTNAYIKWGGYSEMFGFPPVDLCTPIIFLLTPYSDLWSLFPDKPEQSVKVVV